MKIVILDIISNNYKALDSYLHNIHVDKILALTPSACYYLETNSIEFLTFHDLISTKDFRDEILEIYQEVLLLNTNEYTNGFFRDIAQFLSYYLYINTIVEFIKNNQSKEVVYLTDRNTTADGYQNLSNKYSLLSKFIQFIKIINIEKFTNDDKKSSNIFKRYTVKNLISKIINKLLKRNIKYDWGRINPKSTKNSVLIKEFDLTFKINPQRFKSLNIDKLSFVINGMILENSLFMTFLEKNNYISVKELLKQGKKLYFFQHGSYLYGNLFLKYSEIELAEVNFVFNNYTKKLFQELGAKKVHCVGSILFNEPFKERKKEYDYVYITQGHDYMGNPQYVDFPNSLHSFDGYELYQRHQSVIELFGTKFKNVKILIRVHPGVVSSGLYVPFWELAEKYSNVVIDVSMSIHTLIEKSKYIISDYFTSEFINRELHYKRDIILFEGAPTPLPEETIEDMKKMFILVDKVDDLEDKVINIETITKDRKRYDDIIEYYSSKKCDTKKIVNDILKEELNARI